MSTLELDLNIWIESFRKKAITEIQPGPFSAKCNNRVN